MTFDWNKARAFLVTVEEGSLSAAARALGMAQPTLGRQVRGLEEELGVILFEREGRGLQPTPAGLDLLDHVRVMGAAAGRVSLSAAGQSEVIEGKVSIASSEVYAVYRLPAILTKLRRTHPGIQVDIVASNAPSDLRRREADIAIRNFRPSDPDLVARKVGDVPGRFYASPEYLRSIGNPTTKDELAEAQFISVDLTDKYRGFLADLGLHVPAENFPIATESFLTMWAMVKAGLGVGVLDGEIGDADPDVRRALPDMPPLMFPIWLVAHRDLAQSRRMRVVFDLLAAELSAA